MLTKFMAMKYFRILLASVFALSIFFSVSSCKKAGYFQSESKVTDQIKGTWELIPIPRTNPNETWIFGDGSLVRKKAPAYGAEPAPYDTATFSIKTSAMKVEIRIDNFRNILDELNGTWQIVRIDDEFMVMATDHDGSSGIMQREFQRRK